MLRPSPSVGRRVAPQAAAGDTPVFPAQLQGPALMLSVGFCSPPFLRSHPQVPDAPLPPPDEVRDPPMTSPALLRRLQKSLMDVSLLTAAEVEWINSYHGRVWAQVTPRPAGVLIGWPGFFFFFGGGAVDLCKAARAW